MRRISLYFVALDSIQCIFFFFFAVPTLSSVQIGGFHAVPYMFPKAHPLCAPMRSHSFIPLSPHLLEIPFMQLPLPFCKVSLFFVCLVVTAATVILAATDVVVVLLVVVVAVAAVVVTVTNSAAAVVAFVLPVAVEVT